MHTSYWLHERLGILWVLHCLFITQNVRTHTCIDILLCTVDCLLLLYIILFWSELEYSLPAWNITASNANKLECGMWNFATLSVSLPPLPTPHNPYNYAVALSCCSHILYRWQGITLMLFFLLFIFFQALNFVLP